MNIKKLLESNDKIRTLLNETGEWDPNDEQLTSWADELTNEVKSLEKMTNGKLKYSETVGFDKYQGPYAVVQINGQGDSIWDAQVEGEKEMWIEHLDKKGTIDELADYINNLK